MHNMCRRKREFGGADVSLDATGEPTIFRIQISRMLETNSIAPNIPFAFLLVIVVLAASHLAGWMVLLIAGFVRRPHLLLVVTLPLGLLTTVGVISTVFLGRIGHLSMLAIGPLVLAVVARFKGFRENSAALEKACFGTRDVMGLALTLALSAGCSYWLYVWHWPDGRLTLPYNDLGYFSILVKELPSSGVASLWSATLGEHARAAGASDVWYHWGPMWLGCAVSRLSGLSPLVAMIHVVVPALTFLVVFSAGVAVSVLAGCSTGKGMFLAAVSLVALPLPTVSASPMMMALIPGGIEQHLHLSMAYRYCFTYRLEAFIVYAVIACWMLRLRSVAILLVFLAGVSAPHSVAGLGVAAGTFAVIALLRRSLRDFTLGVVVIAALLAAWVANVVFFGVSLPKTGEAKLVVLNLSFLLEAGMAFVRSVGVGVILALPMLAGVLFLIRSSKVGDDEWPAVLGWFGLSALVGSYAAYHLLMPEGERNHFVGYAHAVLLFPIATWGLILAARSPRSWRSRTAVWLLIVMGAFGVIDGWKDWRMVTGYRERFTAGDLEKIKAVLRGNKFGYFASKDRPWWIPHHASLAAVLGSSCTRLNPIREMDEASSYAQFYGCEKPRVLVPQQPEEPDLDWALRFATALGIRFLIETDQDAIPIEIKKRATLSATAAGLRLYELGATN